MYYILLGLFVRNDFYMQNLIDLESIDEYHSYRSLQYLFLGEVYCQAGFLLLIKAFEYLRLYSKFRFLYATLNCIFYNIVSIFFIICYFGFFIFW